MIIKFVISAFFYEDFFKKSTLVLLSRNGICFVIPQPEAVLDRLVDVCQRHTDVECSVILHLLKTVFKCNAL